MKIPEGHDRRENEKTCDGRDTDTGKELAAKIADLKELGQHTEAASLKKNWSRIA